jgi:uncharacterized protein YdeI (BOF family)
MIRIPFGSVGLALAAALFAAGCSESTGPDGAPTDLTVRVYVDADGSGTFNAGDTPVAGATVTATAEDGTGATATTDAQGAATLAGLEPGTYALALSGSTPAGAVLTTASEPIFTATAQGGTAATEFRFAYFPGSVNGVLYRDENGNNTFDAATDLPAPGIPVQLFAGTAATGTPVATTSTSAAGAFSFAGLRPGTYTVRFLSPDGITVVGGATQQVTVSANAPTSVPVRFTGNLRIPIAQARTRPVNSAVTVEGIVTAGRGQLGPRNFYLQDATGGMQVFLPSASTVAVAPGDSVRVSGIISPFNGAIQIAGTTVVVEVLGTRAPLSPRSTSGPEVMARTYEGQLVRVDSLTVVSTAATGATSANVNVRTPQGNDFQIRLENTANVPLATFVVGNTYAVTGVLDVFTNATTPAIPQLKPRSPSDVSDNTPPTIAQVKSGAQGSTVTVTGVVTTTLGEFTASTTTNTGNVYVQDRSGGIQVFGIPLADGLVPGDSVQVTGTLGLFSGEVQITTPNLVVVKLGTGTVPAPRVITGAQLATRAFEGELVRVNDLTITFVGTQSSATSSYNVTATAPDGTIFTVRVEGRTNLERTSFTVGSTYDIVGIGSGFTATGQPTVEQLKPRGTADLIAS